MTFESLMYLFLFFKPNTIVKSWANSRYYPLLCLLQHLWTSQWPQSSHLMSHLKKAYDYTPSSAKLSYEVNHLHSHLERSDLWFHSFFCGCYGVLHLLNGFYISCMVQHQDILHE